MELSANTALRDARGRSAELDGRRVNAVSPMHVGESMLQNLWKEHQQQQQQNHQHTSAITTSASNNGNLKTVSSNHNINGTLPVDGRSTGPVAQQSTQELSKQQAGGKDDNERKLQQMLEKYQSQVKLQQQRAPPQSQQKSTSRNNLHKIEKIAMSARGAAGGSSNAMAGGSVSTTAGHSMMSHSQPCLIAISDRPPEYMPSQPLSSNAHPSSTYHQQQRRSSGSGSGDQQFEQANGLVMQRVPNNQKLIQSLREENLYLKREIETLKKKLSKLQLFESSYDRLVHDYDAIMRDKERQESLESNALAQMELHLKRVIGEKEQLQSRLEQLQLAAVSAAQTTQAMEKVGQLNGMLAELIPKNQELQASNDRQKMEMDAQSATLEEQRLHIAMLEKALGNAQDRLTKRDKTCEELSLAAERANLLQRQLHDSLVDKQARDEAHATERAQWEMEITQLKMQLNKDASLSGSLKRCSVGRVTGEMGDEAVSRLRKTVHARDERITQLERNVVELQRKLHEESERKKCALGALSDNLESKIRRLEDEKNDKDRRIAELTEEKEKLGDILGEGGRERSASDIYCSRGERERAGEESTSRDLMKMEEMRQKIQERKRKGRAGPTGGLIGVSSDHSRSSSGSLLQSTTHLRTSSGPFDPAPPSSFDQSSVIIPLSFGSASRPTGISAASVADPNAISHHHNGYTTTVAFRGERRQSQNGTAEWNV